MFPRTDFMGRDECVKLLYAHKPRRIGLFSPHFLTAELRTQRGSVLQQVTYSRPTVQGNGGTPIFALKWVCRTDTNIELPHCSYRQIE